MVDTPQTVVERIGNEYTNNYVKTPTDQQQAEFVRDAFDTMGDINRDLFADISVDVIFQEDDPYNSYEDMRETVAEESVLRVFSGGDPHPIWDHDTEIQSRAVHDWYGHLRLDVDFSPVGEYRKWEVCRNYYPAYCDRVFFTEVVGQTGAVHYLPDSFGDVRFEQKVFPAPGRWIDQMSRAVEIHA